MEVAMETPRIPEAIFPLEIWDLIFNNLDSPTDLVTCFRTSVAWRKLSEPKRILFLMLEIFPLLYNYLVVADNDSNGTSDDDGENSSHTESSVLNARLVCRSWTFSVNNFLQNASHHTSLSYNSPHQNNIRWLLQPYSFNSVDDPEKLTNFLAKFSPENTPFLTRFVDYWGMHPDQNWTDFKALLNRFGDQIWHAELFYPIGSTYSTKTVYNSLQHQLSLMPNLKTLKVFFKLVNTTVSHNSFNTYFQHCLRHRFDRVEKLLESNPLPKLEQLTTLTLNNVPVPLEKGIILANRHVKQLKLGSRIQGFPDSSMGVPEYLKGIELPNLVKFVANVKVPEDLVTLQALSWPLNALDINSDVKIDKVFSALEKSRFAPDLETLQVISSGDLYDGKITKKLDIPKLQTLQLNIQGPIKTVLFLQPTCASLVNLEIELNDLQTQTTASTSKYKYHSMVTRSMKKRAGETDIVDEGEGFSCSKKKTNFFNRCPRLRRVYFRTFSNSSSSGAIEITRDKRNSVSVKKCHLKSFRRTETVLICSVLKV